MKLRHTVNFETEKFYAEIDIDYFYTHGSRGSWDTPPEGPEIEIKRIVILELQYQDGHVIPYSWLKDRDFYALAKQYILERLEREVDDCLGIWDELCDYAENR